VQLAAPAAEQPSQASSQLAHVRSVLVAQSAVWYSSPVHVVQSAHTRLAASEQAVVSYCVPEHVSQAVQVPPTS